MYTSEERRALMFYYAANPAQYDRMLDGLDEIEVFDEVDEIIITEHGIMTIEELGNLTIIEMSEN